MEIKVVCPFRAKYGQVQNAILHVYSCSARYDSHIDTPDGIKVTTQWSNVPDGGLMWVVEVSKESLFKLKDVLNRIYELEEDLEADALMYRDTLTATLKSWCGDMDVNLIEV